MKIFRKFFAKYLNKKGQRYLIRGQVKKAYSTFQKALFHQNSINILFNIGLSLTALNRNSEAETYYRKVLSIAKDNEIALLALSEALVMQRKWEQANEILQRLIDLSQKNKVYKKYLKRNKDVIKREEYVLVTELLNKSQILSQEKKYLEAKEIVEEALKINPKNANLHNNLGSLIYTITGKPKSALPHFQKAVNLEPQNQKFIKNLSFIQRKIK